MIRTAVGVSVALALSGAAFGVWASSPDAWDELRAKAEAACMAASGLDEPEIVTPTTNFERHVFTVVRGVWPDASSMSGEDAQWVCLYDKEKDAAEAREPGFP